MERIGKDGDEAKWNERKIELLISKIKISDIYFQGMRNSENKWEKITIIDKFTKRIQCELGSVISLIWKCKQLNIIDHR